MSCCFPIAPLHRQRWSAQNIDDTNKMCANIHQGGDGGDSCFPPVCSYCPGSVPQEEFKKLPNRTAQAKKIARLPAKYVRKRKI